MKKVTTLLFVLPFICLAQSKKELRAEIAQKNATIDSMQRQLVIKTKTIDTITNSYVIAQQNYTRLIQVANDLRAEYSRCQQNASRLEQENNKLKSENEGLKPKPTTKKTSQNHANGPSTKSHPDDNPFAGGGGGTGKGTGKLGEDNGEGNGPGSRIIIQKPNVSGIESEEYCTIVFNVSVDENGNITGTPELVKGKTTTDNMALIKKVSALVQSQAKYNAVKGAKSVIKELTVYIESN